MVDIVDQLVQTLGGVSGNPVLSAVLVAQICFASTVIGALPALLGARKIDSLLPYGMGFSAGVMVTASYTSLLLPSIELGGPLSASTGLLLGAILMHLLNKYIPHEHLVKGVEGPERLVRRVRAAWLLAFAIIIHNIPEGAAVGATSVQSLRDGVILALAIGLQDIPEGLAVAAPLLSATKNIRLALGLAVLSGLVEPLAAAGAAGLALASSHILPYMLSFAAGAMLYVVGHEVIPEAHSERRETKATASMIAGVLLTVLLESL